MRPKPRRTAGLWASSGLCSGSQGLRALWLPCFSQVYVTRPGVSPATMQYCVSPLLDADHAHVGSTQPVAFWAVGYQDRYCQLPADCQGCTGLTVPGLESYHAAVDKAVKGSRGAVKSPVAPVFVRLVRNWERVVVNLAWWGFGPLVVGTTLTWATVLRFCYAGARRL